MSISDDPLVSVVLPTYNRAAFLPRAIGSVLAQTHRNLELIVADDGSTDNTEAVVAGIGDARVRYLRCPRNGGAAYARNRGLEQARGELIAFQDSDDEWLPHKLERQLQALREASAELGMVACAYKVVGESGHTWYYRPDPAAEVGDCEASLLSGFVFITPTWLLRRECLAAAGSFDEQLPNREDWDFVFRVLPRWRCQVLGEPLVVKYQTADSLEANQRARIVSYRALLQRHEPRWAHAPKLKAIHYYKLAHALAQVGEAEEAKQALRQSLQLRPLWWRPLRLWLLISFGLSRYQDLREAKARVKKWLGLHRL